jgi:hypothetical protein
MSITIIAEGGLGNQLFQIAAAKSLAKAHNTFFQVEIHKLGGNRGLQAHHFFDYTLFGYGIDLSKVLHNEKDYRFDENFYNILDNVILKGYFQSWKYIENVKDEMRESLFQYKSLLSQNAESFLKTIESNWDRSLAIHIRMGDYCDYIHREHHGILPKSYYLEALSRIEQKDLAIFIFIENISELPNWIYELDSRVTVIQGVSDAESFHLMSKCKYVIAANSSFSWWAGYASNREELSGRVFVPKNYFKTSKVDTADLHPGWFDRIDNGWEVTK